MGRAWSALVFVLLGGCGADAVRETLFSTVLDPADEGTRADLQAMRVELWDASAQMCAALAAYRLSCGGSCASESAPGAQGTPLAEQLVRRTESGWPPVTLDPPDRPLEVVIRGLDATDESFLFGCGPVELRAAETVIPLRRRWCDERACDPCAEEVDCEAAATESAADPGPPACQDTDRSLCEGDCVDLASDPASCGACGRQCSPAERCCGGECSDVESDEQHCGACGAPCGDGALCCGGGCVDPFTDGSNCGDCGVVCTPFSECVAGECFACLFACAVNRCLGFGRRCQACESLEVCGCGEGLPCAEGACCGGACVDVSADPDHCGACDVRCAEGESCVEGKCPCAGGERCPGTQNCCDGVCVDTLRDPLHCGGCGGDCGPLGCVDGGCR